MKKTGSGVRLAPNEMIGWQGISHPQSYKMERSCVRQDLSSNKLSKVYGLKVCVSGLARHSHIEGDLAFRVADIAVSSLVLGNILLERLVKPLGMLRGQDDP